MKKLKVKNTPAKEFDYVSGNTQLLGLVLEGALQGKTISQYMQEKLWQPFINDRENWLKYSGDQNVISEVIMKYPETKSFPDSWTQSYKWHDRLGKRYHKGKWTFEHNGESLVTVFHGEPNPHQSDMEWVKKAWI